MIHHYTLMTHYDEKPRQVNLEIRESNVVQNYVVLHVSTI